MLELEDVEKDSGRLLVRIDGICAEHARSFTKSEFRVNDILYGKLRPYLLNIVDWSNVRCPRVFDDRNRSAFAVLNGF